MNYGQVFQIIVQSLKIILTGESVSDATMKKQGLGEPPRTALRHECLGWGSGDTGNRIKGNRLEKTQVGLRRDPQRQKCYEGRPLPRRGRREQGALCWDLVGRLRSQSVSQTFHRTPSRRTLTSIMKTILISKFT